MVRPGDCCILNGGGGAWAFSSLAERLSRALWVDVCETPRRFNYVLLADDRVLADEPDLFIPLTAITAASDKRALARLFSRAGVPTPETRLLDSLADAEQLLVDDPGRRWCLKYPTGCGAAGHRMLTRNMVLPSGWPVPLVVQEFIAMDRPEVYRTFGAGGHIFGWTVRRYPSGVDASPWVAHVRGARYEPAGPMPDAAIDAGRTALAAVGLLGAFGCVDLIASPDREWLVLEVGTDGLFNHVDRELDDSQLEREIEGNIAEAFWSRHGDWRPWPGCRWQPRPAAASVSSVGGHKT